MSIFFQNNVIKKRLYTTLFAAALMLVAAVPSKAQFALAVNDNAFSPKAYYYGNNNTKASGDSHTWTLSDHSSGNLGNATSGISAPVYTHSNFRHSYTQSLYLTGNDLPTGKMTSIKYQVVTGADMSSKVRVQIYVTDTTGTKFGGKDSQYWHKFTESDCVYDDTIKWTSANTGWQEFKFNVKEHSHIAGKNILVGVLCTNTGNPFSSQSIYARYKQPSSGDALNTHLKSYNNDSNIYDLSNPTGAAISTQISVSTGNANAIITIVEPYTVNASVGSGITAIDGVIVTNTDNNEYDEDETSAQLEVIPNSNVTLTALVGTCVDFEGWYTDAACTIPYAPTEGSYTDNPLTIKSVNENITLYAKATASGDKTINVSAAAGGILNGDYSGTYYCGYETILSATPNTGWSFAGWYNSDDVLVSSDSEYILTITESEDYEARFEPSINISLPSGLYPYGTTVTISSQCEGSTLYYTTDGTAPSPTNNEGYGPSPLTLSLTQTITLRAIAVVSGHEAEAMANYTVLSLSTDGMTNPSGIVMEKSVSPTTINAGETAWITLESYITGTVQSTTTTDPLDVVFVLDYSSSMTGSKIDGVYRYTAMWQAVTNFIDTLQKHVSSYHDQGIDHRVAFINFGQQGKLFYNNGENILATSSQFEIPENTEAYQNAFVDIADAKTIWQDKVKGTTGDFSAWTYMHKGIGLAKNVFSNNSNTFTIGEETRYRKRVLVFFTDGGPTQGNWNYKSSAPCSDISSTEGGNGVYAEVVANLSLNYSYTMKQNYGVDVYSIGLLSKNNVSVADTAAGHDHYNRSTTGGLYSEWSEGMIWNVNRFLNLVSNNYPEAQYMCEGSEGSIRTTGYYFAPSSLQNLYDAFADIATTSLQPAIDLGETAVLQDVIGDNFELPAGMSVDDIEVYTDEVESYSGTGGDYSYTFKNDPQELTTATVQTIDDKHFMIQGFDYAENAIYVNETEGTVVGKKIIVKIPITAKEVSTSGEYNTNADCSAIYDENGNPVAAFTSPTAHLEPSLIHLWTEAVTSYDQTVISSTPTFVVNDGAKTVEISSEQALAWLISYVNGFNGCDAHNLSGYTVTITKDLDMSEYVWVPIGYTTTLAFQGTFDGNYQTIDGIHIANTTEIGYVEGKHGDMYASGMFGYTTGATIKNTFVTSGSLACGATNGYLGGLVGYAKNSQIDFCESAASLAAEGTLLAVGGMAGCSQGSTLKAVMAVGDITFNANVVNAGCIAGLNDGSLTTFYANQNISGSGTVTTRNTTGTNGYTRTNNAAYNMGILDFTAATPYTYGSHNTNNTVKDASNNDVPLVDSLNSGVASGYKWMRSTSQAINGDYPIIVKGAVEAEDHAMAIVNATADGKAVRYGDINTLLGMEKYQNAAYSVFMYNNYEITTAPVSTELYIDEHVAMTQSASCDPITAHVGITLKNPKGKGEMSRDWHMFSTSLQAPPLGILYRAGDQSHTGYAPGSDNYLTFGENLDYWIDEDGYFPSNIADRTQFDFYSYYEPEYHWINLKRKPNNHWHEDEIDGAHPKINYSGENGQTELEQGKGYLVALGNTTDNNNLMQAAGVLNNGVIDIDVTNRGEHLTGYNLLGNPYQSYLDFVEFATYGDNAANLWKADTVGTRAFMIYDAEQGGYVEYLMDGDQTSFSMGAERITDRYIHPHQGFFVVKNIDEQGTTSVRFNNSMRDTTATGTVFRGEAPAYPLVNLECTDSEGKWEHSVIELERPLTAGSLKMKGMLNSKANMYVHWNGSDYSSVFIDHMPDYVPVWFETSEDGVFTFTWNTANADFGYMHLIDHLTGTDYDCLAPGNDHYTFEARATDMAARFRLVFKPLGIEEETVENGENFAFFNGEQLIVNGSGDLQLIDVNGRIIMTEHLSGEQSSVSLPNVAAGVYVLRMTGNSESRVQKIVVRK